MNIRRTSALAALGLCTLVGVVAYRVGRARADGVPTASPLYYGGVLDDGGRPVEGMRSVTIRLWDMAVGGTAACTTVAPNTPFAAGRFRVEMDAACAGAVQANPNLWAEVLVDSTTFARSKLGAVPYALEAGRASGASGALAAQITQLSVGIVAPGTVVAFGGPTPPEGWLLCDGRAVSRVTYRRLFEALNTSWGSGDGAATFNLPDMRGRFVRGVDNGAGRDPDRATREASNVGGNTGDRVGTTQGHMVGRHTHQLPITNDSTGPSTIQMLFINTGTTNRGISFASESSGGSESRPTNVSVNYIVRF